MIVSAEKIYKYFKNKYEAVIVAAMEARRQKELQSKGLLEENVNPIIVALKKISVNKIPYKK